MTAITLDDIAERITAATPSVSSLQEAAWLAARADCVTASEAGRVASARTSSQRRKVLHEKLFGSDFGGNRHTRRGHEREEDLVEILGEVTGDLVVVNRHLWISGENPRHGATPDGFLRSAFGVVLGAEVKTHQHGWTPPANAWQGVIPLDHYDQIQWSMHVLGLAAWLYVWEVREADDSIPITDPHILHVGRDEQRIAELVEGVDDYLAWDDAGAPDDEISEALAAVLEPLPGRKRDLDEAKRAYDDDWKRAIAVLGREKPESMQTGGRWDLGDLGTVTLGKPAATSVLDEAAWAEDDPAGYAGYCRARDLAATLKAEAIDHYATVKRAAPSKRINLPKEKKA